MWIMNKNPFISPQLLRQTQSEQEECQWSAKCLQDCLSPCLSHGLSHQFPQQVPLLDNNQLKKY